MSDSVDRATGIAALFNPRTVAIIGASADTGKTSGLPIQFLRKHGFEGIIYPINPRVTSIGDIPCFPSVAALPEAPDVGMILVGAERTVQAVKDLAARGTKASIVLASGFAEAGEAGRQRQAELVKAAGSMRLLGPNTIGLVNVTDHITLSASGALAADTLLPGKVSVLSQSGGILGSLLSRAAAKGLGLSKLVSTSNEADLDIADFLDFLADDSKTQVIALYIESIRHPEKFQQAAMRVRARGKHMVALKIGRSEAGARAAVSHTGAMAGSDAVYDAFFERYGIIRAQSFSDLLDIPATLATQPNLSGRRIAILTSTGGAGTLIADAIGTVGFETPDPSAVTRASLRALLPNMDIALDTNPIDVTLAGLRNDVLTDAIRALAESKTYDGLVVVVGSSGVAQPDLIANAVSAALPERTFPILAYVSPHSPEAASRLTKLGVPAFTEPESVARALKALLPTKNVSGATKVAPPAKDIAIPDVFAGSLDEAEAKSLFAQFGIPGVREFVASTPAEAEEVAKALDGDVVLKILSKTITHKSDVGGVAVSVPPSQIGFRLERMRRDVAAATGAKIERFLVQQRVVGGVEMILGLRRDPLGSALLLGMGGITAELINDSALRFLPPSGGLSLDEARAMIGELKAAPLLSGYRKRPKADAEALANAIVAFSLMVAQLGSRLLEAEINPLFVLGEGKGVRAADGVVVLTS